jgi:hypothetical protein
VRKKLLIVGGLFLAVAMAFLLLTGESAQAIGVRRVGSFTYMLTNHSDGTVVIDHWSTEIKSKNGWTNYPPSNPKPNHGCAIHTEDGLPISIPRPEGNYTWRARIVYRVISGWKLVANRSTSKLGFSLFGYTQRLFLSREFTTEENSEPALRSVIPPA